MHERNGKNAFELGGIMKKRVYQYSDPVNDDFAGSNIKRKPLKEGYVFYHTNPFFCLISFLTFRLLVVPIAFLYMKIIWRQRVVGKRKLRACRKSGYFMYGNHSLFVADAFTPSLVSFPKKSYILINPDATSIPFVRKLVEMFGGIPVPDALAQYKPFLSAVKRHGKNNHVVVIYPEAHIWPYYTGIRPFKDVSFRYPAELNKPIYTFTRVYTKKRFGKRPKCTIYIDGPFYPDAELSVKQNQKTLRDLAYDVMSKRSKLSDYEVNEYVEIDNRVNECVEYEASEETLLREAV